MTERLDPRRRFLLRGRVSDAAAPRPPTPLRPPWALQEDRFVDRCTRCGDCVAACPQQILSRGDGGFPEVRFTERGCTFCGDCVRVCTPAALQRDVQAPPWQLLAQIGPGCLAHKGVECRICGERCEAGAIRFRPTLGGISKPDLNPAQCTGCGDCVAPCPVTAVVVLRR